ncbi:leptin receptor overlapping transcript-like 1 isoform X2 [Rhinolophus sinicus]|uniref:leptin receptor overlapping transcript-like 1 isoform X2 n=1 Tax=Rhinolophus sinicus TaxID=89399 RepID=UPI003D7BC781
MALCEDGARLPGIRRPEPRLRKSARRCLAMLGARATENGTSVGRSPATTKVRPPVSRHCRRGAWGNPCYYQKPSDSHKLPRDRLCIKFTPDWIPLLRSLEAGRKNGCALKIATFSPKDITPPEGQRPLALPPHRMWDVAGYRRGASDRASANPEGNLGAGVRTPRKPTWEESLRGRRSAEEPAWEGKSRLDSAEPARPPRPSRPRSSASRRRKCCVAHFRVLSGRCRRASVVSRPPPPPWVLEPGATSPPWQASKL